MLKALIRKQFWELTSFYFQDKKTGKLRSAGKTALFALLFAFVFFSVGVMFYGIASTLAPVLILAGLDWLYFSLMGMMTLALGVFGSVFTTYASLYKAKDNELLLAMPISPSKLLFVRMLSVYAMSLLFSALVWLPAVIQYCVCANITVLSMVFSLLLLPFHAATVTVLTCLLGWLVALVAGKLKNKSFATVLAYVIFLAAYYFIYFRLNTMLQTLLLHTEELSHAVRTWIFPIYQVGLAACGETLPMLISVGLATALFALCIFILSRSFVKIVTTNRGAKKTVYREQSTQVSSVQKALFRRELKRYASSPVYMMNTSLGMIFLPAAVVVVFLKKNLIQGLIAQLGTELPQIAALLPVFLTGAVCLMLSTDSITAPSVSLEGGSLWIVRSLPVPARDILRAKLNLHAVINLPLAVVCTPLLGIVLGADGTTVLMITLTAAMFTLLLGRIGLAADLKHPILVWTNESIPVKQNIGTVVSIFGGWAVVLLIVGGGFLLKMLEPWVYLLICVIVLRLITSVLDRWLAQKGAARFDSL